MDTLDTTLDDLASLRYQIGKAVRLVQLHRASLRPDGLLDAQSICREAAAKLTTMAWSFTGDDAE
jgi:hypothetical protein